MQCLHLDSDLERDLVCGGGRGEALVRTVVRFNNDNAQVTSPPAVVVVITRNRYYDFPAIYHYHSYKVSLTNDLAIFDKLLMAIYLSSE